MKLSRFKNNWTKLVLVLLLMSSVLSLARLAQNKPFEAKPLNFPEVSSALFSNAVE